MSTPSEQPPPSPPARRRAPWHAVWLRRIRDALIVVGLTVGAYFLGAAFLPRWWAHRIGDQVNDSIAAGIALGLFYGFVFTFIPLVVLWFAFRKRRPWRHWVAYIVGAIVLASPNLVLLGIVLGTGSGAHAGERTLDVQAPAYRTSVLIGAIAAVVVLGFFRYLLFTRRRARGRLATLRDRLEVAEHEKPTAPAQQ